MAGITINGKPLKVNSTKINKPGITITKNKDTSNELVHDGINFGTVTNMGLNAIQNNTLDSYTPENKDEARVISSYLAYKSRQETEAEEKKSKERTSALLGASDKIAEKYPINTAKVPLSTEETKAETKDEKYTDRNYLAKPIVDRGLPDFSPKNNPTFTGNTGNTLLKHTEEQIAEFMNKKTQPPKPKNTLLGNIGGVLLSVPYAVEKTGTSALNAVEGAGDFLLASGARIIGSDMLGDVFFVPDAVSEKIRNYGGSVLESENLGEKWSENIEKRYAVHDWTRANVGTAFEGVGALLPALATEIYSSGASPMGDIWLSKYIFGNASKLAKSANTVGKVGKVVSPSEIIFGLGAAGQSASDGYRTSGDLSKSLDYGLASGTLEVAIEKLSGGIAGTKYGKTILDYTTKSKPLSFILGTGGEVIEELISTFVDTPLRRLTVDKDAEWADLKDYYESGKQGMYISLIMGVATYPFRNKQRKEAIKTLNTVTEELKLVAIDKNKIPSPLPENASIEDVQQRQKDLQEIAKAYANQVAVETEAKETAITSETTEETAPKGKTEATDILPTDEVPIPTKSPVVETPDVVENTNVTEDETPVNTAETTPVSVGEVFTDTKNGDTFKIVSRDETATAVELTDKDGNVATTTLRNSVADAMNTNPRYVKQNAEDTPVVAEQPTADVQTDSAVKIGDTFVVNNSTGSTIKVVGRDDKFTSVEVTYKNGNTETIKLTNEDADKMKTSPMFTPIENTVVAPVAENLSVENAISEVTPKQNVTFTRAGEFYIVYGDNAVKLAEKLNLTPRTAMVNGVATTIIGIPERYLDTYTKKLGDGYDVKVDETSVKLENVPEATATTPNVADTMPTSTQNTPKSNESVSDEQTPAQTENAATVQNTGKIEEGEESPKKPKTKKPQKTVKATDIFDVIAETKNHEGKHWSSDKIKKFYADNPDLDFIERIYQGDKNAVKELKEMISSIADVKTLEDLSWYVGETYRHKDLTFIGKNQIGTPYRGAITKFRNAIKARIKEIMTEKNNGTNLGVTNGKVSLDEIHSLFTQLNSNDDLTEFADKVFGLAEQLHLDISFVNKMLAVADGLSVGDIVQYKTSFFNDTAVTDQEKARTILHELIHSCTSYALSVSKNATAGKKFASNPVVYERLVDTARQLESIYNEIKNDPDFKGEYGVKDVYEMVAELSNPEFRAKLQKKNLWDKIVDAICNLFGIPKKTDAYSNVRACVDFLLENFDEGLYNQYAKEQRKILRESGKADGHYSYSSIANTFFGDPKMTTEDFENGDYKNSEGYKNYVDTCLNVYLQTHNVSAEEARKVIEESIDGIVRVAIAAKKAGYDIFDDNTKRSKKDSKNRLLFSSLEPNSDYFTSSDISTICDKRKNFADIYDAIVKKEEELGVPNDKRFFNNVDNYFYIHGLMAEMGLTTPCRQCYVESMRKNLAPMAKNFLKLIGETNVDNKKNDQLYHQSGKNKGNIKSNNAELRESVLEKLAEYGMSPRDLTIATLSTEGGLARLKIQAPLIYEAFNSFYGQSKPKMPKSATPFRFGELTALLTDNKGRINQRLVNKINSTGGFRLQSYSDFQIQNYVDVLQTIFEAGTLGLSGHAYTKVPAFLTATEGTNLKRNISIFMYKDGAEWRIDEGDSFPGTIEELYDIVRSDESGNTSIIAVSQNEDMSAWIMANDNVGYGIPFHKSGMKMDTVRATDVKTKDGRTVKGYKDIKDHTRQQTEVWAKTTADHKANTKVKKGIDIYSFWDFDNKDNLSKNALIEKNLKRYIDECEKAGYLPKFREYVMNNDKVLKAVLKYSKELGYVSQDATIDDISFKYKGFTIPYGYYKFLGDFGMFTPDGKASPIAPLSLENYDFDKAVEFFDNSEELRRNEILQQFANDGERQRMRDSNLSTEELSNIVQEKRDKIADEVVSKSKFSLSEDGGKNERDNLLSGDSRRTGDASTQEQTEGLSEAERKRTAEEIISKGQTEQKVVGEVRIDLVKEEAYNDDMKSIVEANNKKGLRTHFFVGNGIHAFDSKRRLRTDGIIVGKDVYLQYDGKFAPQTINRHESVHDSWDTEATQRVANEIWNSLSEAEQNEILSRERYKQYAELYDGDMEIMEMVKQEFIADVLSGMSTYSSQFSELANSYWGETDTNIDNFKVSEYSRSTDAGGNQYSYANTFYSHMARVIDGIKQEKLGADSVVNMLRGKGVKAEEIKWSGIESWLDGKKSVTKAELQEFVAGSMLQIEEVTLDNSEIPYTEEQKTQIEEYEQEKNEIVEELKEGWKKSIGKDIPLRHFGNNIESSVVDALLDADQQIKESTEAGKEMAEARKQLRAMFAEDDLGFDSAEEAYAYADRNPYDFMDYDLAEKQRAILERFIRAKESYKTVEGIPLETQHRLLEIASRADAISRKISKIESERSAESEKHKTKWDEYKLDGGSNYREIAFKMPNSTYNNTAMLTHWDGSIVNGEGVLAHARVQDITTDDGKKMLFIEEIQSDWHNQGHKTGYRDGSETSLKDKVSELRNERNAVEDRLDDIKEDVEKATNSVVDRVEMYPLWVVYASLTRQESEYGVTTKVADYIRSIATDEETAIVQEEDKLNKRLNEIKQEIDALRTRIYDTAPDAPFKDNYHEYVLKRLIRMAVENGYDSIGWTTADIQSERWSDKYAEGYRIEYDQDIPKFLNKYGKKWGAKVGKDTIQGTEVWSMPITESMKDSVLYEGQPMYSLSADDESSGTADLDVHMSETAEDTASKWDEALEKYGAIQKGENPARDIDVPKKRSSNEPISWFGRTLLEAGITPNEAVDDFQREIMFGKMAHEVITDPKAEADAINKIKHLGFEGALNEWNVLFNSRRINKNDFVLGMVLYNQAVTNKDYKLAMKLASDLTIASSEAGQVLQSVRMLKKMSPDGTLYYLEKSVEKMNEDFREQLGDKFKDIEIDPELMKDLFEAETSEDRDKALEKIEQNIADQIPSTLLDKWNAWRYLAMLGNVRTHARNIWGNVVNLGARKIKNVLGTVMEKAISKDKRTKAIIKTKASVAFAKEDANVMKDILTGTGGKYQMANKIQEKRKIFKTKWLEFIRRKNFDFLEAEDWWFLKGAYADSLAQLISARKIDVDFLKSGTKEANDLLNKIRAYAINEAKVATFRQMSELGNLINRTKRELSKGGIRKKSVGVLLEGVLPFTNVPINIAKQGVAYSPLGLAEGIKNVLWDVRKGKVSASEAIDTLSKGLTGTGIVALGVILRALGLIVAEPDDDDKEREYNKMRGHQSYALEIDDVSYTIDWLTPVSLPLFVGVELRNLAENDGTSVEDTINALSRIVDPMVELSVLQGVSDALDSAKYSEESPFVTVPAGMVTSYLGQALPTLGGQVARLIDNEQRKVYIKKGEGFLTKQLKTFIQTSAKKIPLATMLLEPQIDAWGEKKTYGNIVERILESTISPGYFSKITTEEIDEELHELFESTGENSVYPSSNTVKSITVKKEEYNLNAKQSREYAEIRGQESLRRIKNLINNKAYETMSDEEKLKWVKHAYEKAKEKAKETIYEKYFKE